MARPTAALESAPPLNETVTNSSRDLRFRSTIACQTCSKAKVKCSFTEGSSKNGPCQRCSRLNKQCSKQMPGTHRRKGHPCDPNVKRLEEKLDSIVEMMAVPAAAHGLNLASGRSNGLNTSSLPIDNSTVASAPSSSDSLPNITTNTANKNPFVHGVQDLAEDEDEDEAEVVLDLYRSKRFPFFPFVTVPTKPNSGKELRKTKPLLYQAIEATVCSDSKQQPLLGAKLFERIIHCTILKIEQSLDSIQALLLFLAWHHFFLKSGHNIVNVLHILASQVKMMRLDTKPPSGAASVKTPQYLKEFVYARADNSSPSLEERRTFLGCFYASQIWSSCVQDIEVMTFTSYVEDCCKLLEETGELDTDFDAVCYVRLARLAEQASRLSFDPESDRSVSGKRRSYPMELGIKCLQAELDNFAESALFKTRNSYIMRMHFDTVRILLYRSSLDSYGVPAEFGNHCLTQLELFYSCVEAIRSFYNNLLSIDPQSLFSMCYMVWSQFPQAISTTYEAFNFRRVESYSTHQIVPGGSNSWDTQYASSKINLYEVLDILLERIETGRAQTSRSNTDGRYPAISEIFAGFKSRVEKIKESYENSRKAAEEAFVASNDTDNSAIVPDFELDLASLDDLFMFPSFP